MMTIHLKTLMKHGEWMLQMKMMIMIQISETGEMIDKPENGSVSK